MSGNVSKFYDSLIAQFGEPSLPDEIDQSLFLQQFKEDLAGFSDEVYNLACKKLRRDREAVRFPKPNGKILGMCEDIRDQLEGKTRTRITAEPAIRASDRRTAQQLVLDNIGLARDAAREGWIHGLWDFCRVKQRCPVGEKELAECRHGVHGLLKTTPETDAREERLKKLVFGEAA